MVAYPKRGGRGNECNYSSLSLTREQMLKPSSHSVTVPSTAFASGRSRSTSTSGTGSCRARPLSSRRQPPTSRLPGTGTRRRCPTRPWWRRLAHCTATPGSRRSSSCARGPRTTWLNYFTRFASCTALMAKCQLICNPSPFSVADGVRTRRRRT